MPQYPTLAAVDLGSNSFRLQIGRVVGGQIYELDSVKETIRLAAGLDSRKNLSAAAQQTAVDCLKRFSERLRHFPPESVRAVGTNTLRVAKNSADFLRRAEAALGFPIEIIAGREEARLIYLGVARELPHSREHRLVVDIGGGSTESIIGAGLKPLRAESLYMGCVTWTTRFFADGRIAARSMQQAELAARAEVSGIAEAYREIGWAQAIGSSGTARALAEIIVQQGWAESGITRAGLKKLRARLIQSGDIRRLALHGLTPDRVPVICGGFAIMAAIFDELGVEEMHLSDYALRHGVLYDLLGRAHRADMREATVAAFQRRYQVDGPQAQRVARTALRLYQGLAPQRAESQREYDHQMLGWAAGLHEVGISIAYSGYHKHSAYILGNADMPGFSRMDQAHLAALVNGHRGALAKWFPLLNRNGDPMLALTLRLAVLLHRRRSGVKPPPVRLAARNSGLSVSVDRGWLKRHPLTESALAAEAAQWQAQGVNLRLRAER